MKSTRPLYRAILKHLDESPIRLRFRTLSKEAGVTLGNGIWIDHREDILRTFIHELLHQIYSEWTEAKTVRVTEWYYKNATWRQKRKILEEMLAL